MTRDINKQRDEIIIRFMSLKRFLLLKIKEYEKVKKCNQFDKSNKKSDYANGRLDAYKEVLEKFEMMTMEEKIRRAR